MQQDDEAPKKVEVDGLIELRDFIVNKKLHFLKNVDPSVPNFTALQEMTSKVILNQITITTEYKRLDLVPFICRLFKAMFPRRTFIHVYNVSHPAYSLLYILERLSARSEGSTAELVELISLHLLTQSAMHRFNQDQPQFRSLQEIREVTPADKIQQVHTTQRRFDRLIWLLQQFSQRAEFDSLDGRYETFLQDL